MFRRMVATAVHAHAGVDLAAELLGHADPRTIVQHYIRRNCSGDDLGMVPLPVDVVVLRQRHSEVV